MATKTINAILALKDRFSKPLENTTKKIKVTQREIKAANNTVSKFASNANNKFKSVAKSVTTATTAFGGLAAGVAIKKGFSDAMDLEGFRLQLETATKDSKKAADVMAYSVKLANSTPFESAELVEGAAKLEAMGLSAKKWLPTIGDMAAATNKPFDQAIEAFIDAQTGELERLKEFGVTKAKITEKANQMYRNQEVVNAKGQITDYEKFNNALVAIMEDRFSGGMEKQASTMRGVWSSMTDFFSSGLTTIVGISSDGSIKAGSVYEKLKNKMIEVGEVFQKWQENGVFEKIGETISTYVDKAVSLLSNSVKWLKDNMNWLIPVAAGLLSTFVAFNVITKVVAGYKALTKVTKALKTAQGALNLVMKMNPIGLISVAIGLLVAAGIALYKNWDVVKRKAKELWEWIKGAWEGIKQSTIQIWSKISEWLSSFPFGQALLETIKSVVDNVKNIFNNVIDFFKNIFAGNWGAAWENVINIFKSQFELITTYAKAPLNALIELINMAIRGANKIQIKMPEWAGGQSFGINIPEIPRLATGSKYFGGGQVEVGEHGGEILDLPNGTKVIPNDISKRMADNSASGVNVNITIQGNVIGNESYANELGNIIVKRLTLALGNV